MQAEHLEKIRNENATLIEQNQNLLILYQNVFALLHLVNNHYYHKEFFDYLFKIRSSVTINQMSLPIIILLYHNNNEEQGAKEERDDNRK
ncbi:MAG: hypothetical protein H0W19_07220 [Nitrosopumilus sp.]|nr:hypothetical protein [Nitrosopumilus sp.]